MAEAVFEEHPLEQYLRDAGEVHELMPGTSLELIQEIDIDRHLYEDLQEGALEGEMEWRPHCLIVGLNALESFLSSARPSSSCNPFVERFKYNVISSALLSTSLSNPLSARSSLASIPGRLPHSRSTSLDLDGSKSDGSLTYAPSHHYGPISIAAFATAIFASLGSRFFATLSLGCLSYFAYNLIKLSESPCHDFTPTFTALDELVSSNSMWETTVQEALQVLEKEEANLLRSSTPSSTPTNSLRVSLHTTLQATRTQCDNVRQLFSALTCPTELAQLSEMYAPPSPQKSPLSLVETSPRPYSFPTRNPNLSTPQSKRQTWHASYSGLASVGSPPSALSRKREKRRSNVAMLFQQDFLEPSSSSAPVTPSPLSPLPVYPLGQIAEDLTEKLRDEDVFGDAFGPAALDLRRKRQSVGSGALSPPPSQNFRTSRSRRLSNATLSSSSRFTGGQPPRHPLSLFALQQSLQGAISSKRYACSHLLALRFNEDEEEYWENVRSMMELLTTTFTDEAARLAEALEDVERQHFRDQNPTPDISREFEEMQKERMGSLTGKEKRKSWSPLSLSALAHERAGSTSTSSFAPMPSHLSRFAAHVAAIMSALEDAREHLRDCVDSLTDEGSPSKAYKRSRTTSLTGPDANEDGTEEHRALLAYDRLRRELGLALRECERGKQKLVDIVHPPPLPLSDDEGSDGVPAFGHDRDPSDDSDKLDPASPSEDEDDALRSRQSAGIINGDVLPQEVEDDDDVSSHLLNEASIQNLLAAAGIEQVYEADEGGVGAFTRERSKMSREERIQMIKARRDAASKGTGSLSGSGDGLGLYDEASLPSKLGKREVWGPGGEVVQELKDVIWKVGEKRRKVQEQFQAQQPQRRVVEVPGVFGLAQEEKMMEVRLSQLPVSPSPPSPSELAYELEPEYEGVSIESS